MPETILPDPGSGYQWRPRAGRRSSPRCLRWQRTRELHALGRALRELGARRDLSQEELGAEAGLHRNYVGALERGEINPTFCPQVTATCPANASSASAGIDSTCSVAASQSGS